MATFRKVIVSRGGSGGHPRRRVLLHDLAAARDLASGPEIPARRGAIGPRSMGGALIVVLLALLLLVTSEVAVPALFELVFATMLLGFGLAAAGVRPWRHARRLSDPSRPVSLDAQEQVRRHTRLLERRRERCLQAMADLQRCVSLEDAAGRPTERLDAAAEALTAAVAAFDAGIAREQAAGLALRVSRWVDRLPSLFEGWERLDAAACRQRLQRLEAVAQEGDALDAELREFPSSAEETARRALSLLTAGRDELARVRIDLLARQSALLARAEPPRLEGMIARAEIEAALTRCWDWLSRHQARRELHRWEAEAPVAPLSAVEPVRIVLPRGRDMSMLPFSLVLLGFTTAHASLAVGDVAMSAPFLLLPMAGFYALFLVPGFLLFREAVRARRHEELTICGSAVMLRWRWLLWSGAEAVVASPDEPVRREEVGGGDAHPIGRLSLRGLDGRKLSFAFGLTDAQHAQVVRQMGRTVEPALPASLNPRLAPPRPSGIEQGADGEGGWGLPLF